MRISRAVLTVLLAFGVAGNAFSDVLILKSGKAITGKFQGGDPGGVTFLVDGQMMRYQLTDVHSITILPVATTTSQSPAPAPASAPSSSVSAPSGSTTATSNSAGGWGTAPSNSAPAATTSSAGTSSSSSGSTSGLSTRPATSTTTASASPSPVAGVVIPEGTTITVRMIDPVDSSVNQMGETFRASLDEPLIVNGKTIASRGADVTTKLVSVQEAGRVSGRSEIALALFDVTIAGKKYEVTSTETSQAGSSRTNQTVTRVGGLAALGAVIGAIAGGGGGAARGAVAGAGAGTAIQVLTHGEKVQIPAESRLDFTLNGALTL